MGLSIGLENDTPTVGQDIGQRGERIIRLRDRKKR